MKIPLRLFSLEPVIFIFLIALLSLVWGFWEIAEEVIEGDTHDIDKSILMMLRNTKNSELGWGPIWFQEMMRDVTSLGSTVFLSFSTLSVFAFFIMKKHYQRAIFLLGAVTTGMILSNLLKFGFDRPRPNLVPHGSSVYTSSFPSSHSMMSAFVFLSLGILLANAQTSRKLKIYFISLALFLTFSIGFSRIYLGVHWPSDVLAGWIAGATCALLFWLGERFISQRAKRDDPA